MLAMDGRPEVQAFQKGADFTVFHSPTTTLNGSGLNGSHLNGAGTLKGPGSKPIKTTKMGAADSKSAAVTTASVTPDRAEDDAAPMHKHMWIVTGPAGSGKTTVAKFLAEELEVPYIEGDDYHPPANLAKMAQNEPLTDADRWDWLITLRDAGVRSLRASPSHTGVVVTCSALKRKYRDVLRVAAYEDHGVAVHFVYLHAPETVLRARVAARTGHYMGPSMVRSQLLCLEAPAPEEVGRDVLSCDCAGEAADVQRHVLAKVRKVLAEDRAGYGSEEW